MTVIVEWSALRNGGRHCPPLSGSNFHMCNGSVKLLMLHVRSWIPWV